MVTRIMLRDMRQPPIRAEHADRIHSHRQGRAQVPLHMIEQAHIYHIAHRADIGDPDELDEYRCESLNTEGFIHCCDYRQLAGVTSRYYAEIDDLLLLVLDVDKIDAPVVRENTVGGSELFPHVYGPLKASAVVHILPFGIHSTDRQGLWE